MIAQQNIKIARPLNSPRSVRQTPRSKAKHSTRDIFDSRNLSDFDDQETLAKQKYDIINEIIALRKECDQLSDQVNDKERDNDEKQLLEIEFNVKNEQGKNLSEYQRRVLVFSKQLSQLQAEMNELDEKHNLLSTLFSDDAIVRLKSEIVFEKHTIGHQRDELSQVMQVRDTAQNELDSEDLTIGIQMCRNQRKKLAQLKNEFSAEAEKEDPLNLKYQETLKLPKEIEAQENEIKDLNQRLKNLSHSKDSRKRELANISENVETEKDVMGNVTHISTVQRSKDRERENFSSTVVSSRSGRKTGRAGRAERAAPKLKKRKNNNNNKNTSASKTKSSNLGNTTGTMGEDDFENDFDKTGKTFGSDFEKTGKTIGSDFETSGEVNDKNKSDTENSEKSEKSGSEKSEKSGSGNSDEEKSSGKEEEKGSGDSDKEEKGSGDSDKEEKGSDDSDKEEKGSDDSDKEEKDSGDSDKEEKDSGDSDKDSNDSEKEGKSSDDDKDDDKDDDEDDDDSDDKKKNSDNDDTDEMSDKKGSDNSDEEKSNDQSDDNNSDKDDMGGFGD